MRSLFICPVCAAALQREERRYICPAGHSFDRAKEGYCNLLPVNRKHSKAPGDDKAMAAARSVFLGKGYYGPYLLGKLTNRCSAVGISPQPVGN